MCKCKCKNNEILKNFIGDKVSKHLHVYALHLQCQLQCQWEIKCAGFKSNVHKHVCTNIYLC